MSKLPFTPKMMTSFGTTPGMLPGSTLGTGVEVDTGLDTAGTLPGATTSDPNASSEFSEPTPSPALDREPGVDRRAFLRWGALGTAGLLVGCGKKKQQRPQVQTKPGKDPSDLKRHVEMPPDGLVDPAVGYETFVHPERTGFTVPDKNGLSMKGKVAIGAGALTGVGVLAWGLTVYFVRRANKFDTKPRSKLDPDLMTANEYCDLGDNGIQIRHKQADGSLATTVLKNIGDITYVRALEKHRPIFPKSPLKWPAWRRGDLKRCTFKPEEMMKAQGITEEQLQERKDAAEFIKKGIAQGWIRKVELKDKKGVTIDTVHEFLLTPYTPKKKAAKTKEAKAPEAAPAPAATDGDTADSSSVEIKTHAFVIMSDGGCELYIKDEQKVAYAAPWQGMVIQKLEKSENGMALGLLRGQVPEKDATDADLIKLLQDLCIVGVLAAGSKPLPADHKIMSGIEYKVTAPVVSENRAEEKLGNDKGVRPFSLSAASETKSDTGGQQSAPDQGEPEEGTLATVGDVEPLSISALLGGSAIPPAPPAEAPAMEGAPAPIAAPPLPTPPSDGPSRDAGRKPVDRALRPEEVDETVALTKDAQSIPAAAVKKPENAPAVDEDESASHRLSDSDIIQMTGHIDPLAFDNGSFQHTFEDEEAAVLRLLTDGPVAGDIVEQLKSEYSSIDETEARKAVKGLKASNWIEETPEGLRIKPDHVNYFVVEKADGVEIDPDDIIDADDIVDEVDEEDVTSVHGPEVRRVTSPTIMTPKSAQKDLDAKIELVAKAEETLANRKSALDDAMALVTAARRDLTEARETRDTMEDAALGATDDATIAEFADAQKAVDDKKEILQNAQKEAKQLSGSVQDATKELEAANQDVKAAQRALDEAKELERAKAEAEKAKAAKAAEDDFNNAAETQEMKRSELEARLAETPGVKIAREHFETQQKAVEEARAAVDAAQALVNEKTAAMHSATKDTRKQARAELSDANAAFYTALDVLEAHEGDEEAARAEYERAQQEAAEEAARAAAEEAERAARAAEEAKRVEAEGAAQSTAAGSIEVDERAMTHRFQRTQDDDTVRYAEGHKLSPEAAEANEELDLMGDVTVPRKVAVEIAKYRSRRGSPLNKPEKNDDGTVTLTIG